MLDATLKEQLREIFAPLTSQYTLQIELSADHPQASDLIKFLGDVASCSPKIDCSIRHGEAFGFAILKDGEDRGISFRAIPNGHEFTSLLLAILNLDGRGKNLPDNFTSNRIMALQGPIKLSTYMLLTCTSCPEVVQALNAMATLSDNISHVAIDGALYQSEVEALNIQSVPTVYANGELLYIGRGGVAELLSALESRFESTPQGNLATRHFDVVVAGGGPAGSAAALYLARKNLSVALVAERIGGQVCETTAIENIPSVAATTGSKLAADLREQILELPTITLLENRTIESASLDQRDKSLQLKGGETITAPQLIIATGAQWRKLGINGEADYLGRGVAFCPHCDGPLFKGRNVAVIGGGNSGVEAAIDLAAICHSVTLIEFMPSLKADEILQSKLRALSNVTILSNRQTTQILGDGVKVNALEIADRTTEQLERLELDGIFIQIGLSATSSLFKEAIDINRLGEIEVDRQGRTSQAGVYAAGDVTDSPYKQIVVAMGAGATAALAAFEDRLREE